MNSIRNTSLSNLPIWAKTSAVIVICLAAISLNACRTSSDEDLAKEEPAVIVPHLHQNNLGSIPKDDAQSNLLRNQAESPINWQPWSKSVFKDAAKEKKTLFAFIGSGTDPYTLETLKQLNQSSSTCANLNEHHINILLDSNLNPALEFFVASFCIKSESVVSSPLLVWFSHEGIPISWTPINRNRAENISGFISRTSNIVSRMWMDSSEYVLKNSREDFTRRMASLLPKPVEDKEQLMTTRATRQVASLFDPTSTTVDGMGGMSIARHIKLLSASSHNPEISDNSRKRYTQMARSTADNMILQGLIDPLDGGVYSGLQQSTTALPIFSKKLRTQAYTIDALYYLYQTTKDINHLKAADEIVAYTEKNLILPDGGYSLGIIYGQNKPQDNPCTWTLEELEVALTPEELSLSTRAFGILGLGNIPLIDDPYRIYFRHNTLTWKLSMKELSTSTGIAPAALAQQLESITKKLTKLRTEKSPNRQHEKLSTTNATALLASAYVTAYRATSDPKHLDRAIKTITFIRKQFIDDSGNLRHARFNGHLLNLPAVGVDYAQLTQAALDLHEVTLNPAWLQFASDIHLDMSKKLGNTLNYNILENDGADYPYPFAPYQIVTFRALNNSCTWALAYSNAKRLLAQKNSNPLQSQCKELRKIMLATIQMSALASIDFLTVDAKLNQAAVYLKMPIAPELLKTALKKNCQLIAVSEKNTEKDQYQALGNKAADIPAQGATVIQRGKILGTTTQAEMLDQLIP